MSVPSRNKISETARILSPGLLEIGNNVQIMDYVVIGVPNEYDDLFKRGSDRRIKIGDGTILYPHTVIYEGATLGAGVIMEEGTRVGSLTVVGDRTRIVYNAQIHDKVKIGLDCVIGGFIADNATVGSRTSVFGALVHRYSARDPRKWAIENEIGPTIGDDVLIAWGSVIIGEVSIGSGARIYPNCVVTRDIKAGKKFNGA